MQEAYRGADHCDPEGARGRREGGRGGQHAAGCLLSPQDCARVMIREMRGAAWAVVEFMLDIRGRDVERLVKRALSSKTHTRKSKKSGVKSRRAAYCRL